MKSSNQIFFYKLEIEGDNILNSKKNQVKWTKYYEINVPGFFVSTKGSDQIQIVTDQLVYFYSFDEDLMPKLDIVMSNFMGCISLQMDNNDKICITYKTG